MAIFPAVLLTRSPVLHHSSPGGGVAGRNADTMKTMSPMGSLAFSSIGGGGGGGGGRGAIEQSLLMNAGERLRTWMTTAQQGSLDFRFKDFEGSLHCSPYSSKVALTEGEFSVVARLHLQAYVSFRCPFTLAP